MVFDDSVHEIDWIKLGSVDRHEEPLNINLRSALLDSILNTEGDVVAEQKRRIREVKATTCFYDGWDIERS